RSTGSWRDGHPSGAAPRPGDEGMSAASVQLRRLDASARISARRRAKDRAFTIFLAACGLLAMLPLAFIAGYVVVKGASALNLDFFTKEPAVPGEPGGGIVQAFIGSGLIVGMATLFSVPLGVMGGVYL